MLLFLVWLFPPFYNCQDVNSFQEPSLSWNPLLTLQTRGRGHCGGRAAAVSEDRIICDLKYQRDFTEDGSMRHDIIMMKWNEWNLIKSEWEKVWSRLSVHLQPFFSAHSAYFNNNWQKIPYFDASRQKRVLFNCFATKQFLGMLKMWG